MPQLRQTICYYYQTSVYTMLLNPKNKLTTMKFLATREKNLGCFNLVFHVAKSFLTEISQGLLFLLKSPTFFAKAKSDGKITSKANHSKI